MRRFLAPESVPELAALPAARREAVFGRHLTAATSGRRWVAASAMGGALIGAGISLGQRGGHMLVGFLCGLVAAGLFQHALVRRRVRRGVRVEIECES